MEKGQKKSNKKKSNFTSEKIKPILILVALISIIFAISINAEPLSTLIKNSRTSGTLLKDSSSATTQSIPSEYDFVLAKNTNNVTEFNESAIVEVPQTAIDDWGTSWTSSGMGNTNSGTKYSLATDSVKGNYWALYKSAGVYNGKYVDIKATIMDFESTDNPRSNPAFKIRTSKTVGHNVIGIKWIKIKYEFFEAGTTNPINVKGRTSYWDIDNYQGIIFDDNNKGIYIGATPENILSITTINNKKYIYEASGQLASDYNTPEAAISETFEGTSITRTYTYGNPENDWYGASGGMGQVARPVTNVEISDPVKSVSKSNVEVNETYNYNIG